MLRFTHRFHKNSFFMKNRRLRQYLLALGVVLSLDLCLQSFLFHQITFRINKRAGIEKRIQNQLQYFPLAVSSEDPDLTFSYVDTWNQSRTYGGNRHHEGTDIMTSVNHRGVYPVISMSDGTVEKLGWLKLGGYRIGIRTKDGLYLYYAHLESYVPELAEGQQIQAGECLGFVGDSGYGPEGTTGKFASHLHVGIYLPDGNGTDQALNPYPYLKKLDTHVLTYDFTDQEKNNGNDSTG